MRREKKETKNLYNIVVGAFYNFWYNLQWVASNLVFFACNSSISYWVSNWIRSVLRTNNKVDRLLFVSQIKTFLSSSFPSNKYINGSSLLIMFLYGLNIMKKVRKNWSDKNRFHDPWSMIFIVPFLKFLFRKMSSAMVPLTSRSNNEWWWW